METNTHNIYLFKALDAYPYNLEEAIEALNYALSYDENSVQALCLMAKIHAYQLRDYESAKYYFELAVASNMEMSSIYTDYIHVLTQNEDSEEAQKLLDFALTVKGTDKEVLYLLQGRLYEDQKQYKKAIKALRTARKLCMNNDLMTYLTGEMDRIKGKLPKSVKKRKKNKKNKREEKKRNRSKKK